MRDGENGVGMCALILCYRHRGLWWDANCRCELQLKRFGVCGLLLWSRGVSWLLNVRHSGGTMREKWDHEHCYLNLRLKVVVKIELLVWQLLRTHRKRESWYSYAWVADFLTWNDFVRYNGNKQGVWVLAHSSRGPASWFDLKCQYEFYYCDPVVRGCSRIRIVTLIVW